MSGFDLPPMRLDRNVNLPTPQGPGFEELLPQGTPEIAPSLGGVVDSGPRDARPFEGVLADSIDNVRGLQSDVKEKVRGMVMGEGVELHDAMIAGSKSQVAFNLLLEVRNKMVDAWEKLSRSSV
ncbi:MAG: flagellar hook-basal body complex protein FliE [Planctomycetota bacterium]